MISCALTGTQDSEIPEIRLLYGEAFKVVRKVQTEFGLDVEPGHSVQFIRMRQGSPTMEKRDWSSAAPFVQPTANIAYRGLVPFAAVTLLDGETELFPLFDDIILLAATWLGSRDEEGAFSVVMNGLRPLIVRPDEQHLWLDKTRDIRPMLTSSKEQWVVGREASRFASVLKPSAPR